MLMTAVSLLAVSCSDDPDPITMVKDTGNVAFTQSAEPAQAGKPFKIDVRFALPVSCSSFDSFETWKEADTLMVRVWCLRPEHPNCTKEIRYETKSLMHTFATAGTHYLKFFRYNDIWYRDTITVVP
ncbi:hypothetical protein [Chitinophaga sp. YIM B06452]|uniref:hypothetical protein n=1 Tax=Chitinophaga sp. YIM B06452 TaxID=3082158 RepID=UPI0031FF29D1